MLEEEEGVNFKSNEEKKAGSPHEARDLNPSKQEFSLEIHENESSDVKPINDSHVK